MNVKPNDIPTILKRIIDTKHDEVRQKKIHVPLAVIEERIQSQSPVRGFYSELKKRVALQQPAVIAEIKKASPSKGVIREQFDPISIAKSYQAAGAACLSVLTDEQYFQGSDDYLIAARNVVHLPVLRKDFMVDPYQILESRAMGADCVLLIVAALSDAQLQELHHASITVGLDVLVEVHTLEELERAKALHPNLLGINNRDLHTFNTDLATTARLRAHCSDLPDEHILITESGIDTASDVDMMLNQEVYAFLVGEAFMRVADPGAALQRLFSFS